MSVTCKMKDRKGDNQFHRYDIFKAWDKIIEILDPNYEGRIIKSTDDVRKTMTIEMGEEESVGSPQWVFEFLYEIDHSKDRLYHIPPPHRIVGHRGNWEEEEWEI